jgi:hypothetical protein
MVIINAHSEEVAVRSFDAVLWNISGTNKPSFISYKFQPVVININEACP